MKKVLLLLLFMFVFQGCEEEQVNEPKDPKDSLYHGIAVTQTNDSDFDYIANDENGNMVLYDWQNDHVSRAICRDKSGNWVEMIFNEDGTPSTVYSEDYIVIINNIFNGKADFAVVERSTGNISVYREVDFNINLAKQQILSKNLSIMGWYGDVAQGLRIASTALTTFYLTAAYIGVAPGPHSPVALALSGTALVLSVVAVTASEHFEELEASSTAFSVGADVIGCAGCIGGDVGGCIGSCVGLGLTISAEVLDIIDERQDEIALGESALEHGYGDVQVTLTWNNTADLDLLVTDPNNETIYYDHTTSASGGQLDIDDMDGYGPENIFWGTNQAPSGTYKVYVHHYSGASPANYDVLINAFGKIDTYSGTIYSEQTIAIAEFNSSGLAKAENKKTKELSINLKIKKR